MGSNKIKKSVPDYGGPIVRFERQILTFKNYVESKFIYLNGFLLKGS